jgi:hypothetical protein
MVTASNAQGPAKETTGLVDFSRRVPPGKHTSELLLIYTRHEAFANTRQVQRNWPMWRRGLRQSLRPEDLIKILSYSALRDLVEFLAELK